MGRVRTIRRPPSSGAVIFYGGTNTKAAATAQVNEGSQRSQSSDLPEDVEAKRRASTSSKETDVSRLSLSDSGYRSSLSSHESESSVVSGQVLKDFGAVISLSKDIIGIFSKAPYVQVIAQTLLQIIEIAQSVQANKERADELVQKIVLYAGVVFEALKSPYVKDGSGLNDLKGDLAQLGKVFDSCLTTLQALFDKKQTSRFAQILRRDDHKDKIQELDRKLDTFITSFQVKSAIVLRSTQSAIAISSQANSTTTHTPTTRPPPLMRMRSKPRIMLGRSQDISARVELILSQCPARLAILGPGGIGKTSLALAVAHDEKIVAHYGQRRLFISCEAAKSSNHILADLAWALQLQVEGIQDRLLEAICDQLRMAPYLLVLDNFETPWESPEARSEIEFLLEELDSIETVTLVLTMRGSQHPKNVKWSQLSPPLQPVDVQSAREIFKAICKQDDEYSLKLITAVDCMPLAVTLLANLAAVDGETTGGLWKRWSAESISMVESGSDRLSSIDASIKLSLSSPRMLQNPEALKLLSTIALLPQGVSPELVTFLERGIPDITNAMKAIATLRQNSLVSSDSLGYIRILSPIRLHVTTYHQPPMKARLTLQDYFLDLALRAGTCPGNLRDQLYREVGNTESLLIDALNDDVAYERIVQVAQAILSYCHYTYLYCVSSTHALSLVLKKLEKNPPPSNTPPALISGTKSVGQQTRWQRRIGKFGFWKGPTSHQEHHPSPPPPITPSATISHLKLRADCLGCLGQLYTREYKYDEAKDAFNTAKELHAQAEDVAGEAYDAHNLACLLSRTWLTDGYGFEYSEPEECVELFEAALKLHEHVEDEMGMAYDLLGLGNHLLQTSDISQVEATVLEALTLFRELGDSTGQLSCLTTLGQANISLSALDKSKEYFEQALAMTSDDIMGKAENLAGLASTYLLRSQFSEALKYIEEAIAIRSPIENPDHLHLLGRIFLALYRFDEAETTLRRAHDLHNQVLDSMGILDDRLYLTFLRFYQGRLKVGESEYEDESHEVEDQDDEDAGPVHPFNKIARDYKDYTVAYANAIAVRGVFRLVWQGSIEPNVNEGSNREDSEATNEIFEFLEEALGIFEDVGCKLGQAFSLHHLACAQLRCNEISKAKAKLERALKLHEEVGNVQGQADDHNKLAEVQMREGLLQEAMNTVISDALRLHTQIGDIGGQGDDVYLQACIYLKQGRSWDAEEAIKQALDLHTRAQLAYQKALDLATLSSIVWDKYLAAEGKDAMLMGEAYEHLEEAIRIFRRCHSRLEFQQCSLRLMEMKKVASGELSS